MESIISIDSSVLINHFRKKNKEASFFYFLVQQYEQFVISVITGYEILVGAKESSQAKYWKNIFTDFFIINYSSQINSIALNISFELFNKGLHIEFKDLIIASTALYKQVPPATLNKKHFINIQNLSLITPESL